MDIIDKHVPREYSLIIHDSGIVLCDKRDGAIMCFRFASDITRLVDILGTLRMSELPGNSP